LSDLGEEKWVILEQVFVAALEIGELQLSKECLQILAEKFSFTSSRISRLRAMRYEALGKFDKALNIYDTLLLQDNTDTATMKRKICIMIQNSSTSLHRKKAIKYLIEYLSVFMADHEAWGELADLYIKENMFKQSAFCYEELILVQPQNYHYYVKCAEAKYTIGGLENLLEAMNYYTLSLEITKENNNRALFGLYLTINTIMVNHKGSFTDEMKDSIGWITKNILELYKNSEDLNLIERVLKLTQ